MLAVSFFWWNSHCWTGVEPEQQTVFPAAHSLTLIRAQARDLQAKGCPDLVLQKRVLAEPRVTPFPEMHRIEPAFMVEYWQLQINMLQGWFMSRSVITGRSNTIG